MVLISKPLSDPLRYEREEIDFLILSERIEPSVRKLTILELRPTSVSSVGEESLSI